MIKTLVSVSKFVVIALAFGLAYTQDPIFNSPENQNTKYLQGLAKAGLGFLNEDWLVSTVDPLPVFTFLVKNTYQYLHSEYAFYAYYIIIFGAYIYSLIGIAASIYPIKRPGFVYVTYLALFIFLHTVDIKIGSFETDWHLQAGVAGQYILGPVFQPANFGVFILLSIWAFLYHKPFIASALLSVAAIVHPAYFPSAAALMLAYILLLLWYKQNLKQALFVGVLFTILVLPKLGYMHFAFPDTSPEIARQATEIIVNERIPHHSIPAIWLADGSAYVQTLWVVFALYLVRKHQLFWLLCLPFLIAVGLTLAQIVSASETLAFLAPWRISAFLVPIATSIVLAQVVTFIFAQNHHPVWQYRMLISRLSMAMILTLVVIGIIHQIDMFQDRDRTMSMMNFIKTNRQAGETYLIPPATKDLRKFRLYTGAPILVNQKSHPYLDTEVIEWHRRLGLAHNFYAAAAAESCRILREDLSGYAITHVVLPKENFGNSCPDLQELYRDDDYEVYATPNGLHSQR
ncbi:MAG: hypothetical protein F6K19_14945 [Cyanothece sp. SIO1E1]|nr:hypothetical protein [Cyanothece sp. SIO1E1]